MASVRKREWEYKGQPRSAWVVDYTDQEGKRRQATFKTRKEATAYRAHVEVEIRNGEHIAISQTVTLYDAMDDFMKYCESRSIRGDGIGNSAVENYRTAIVRCKKAIGPIKMISLSYAHLQKLSDDLADRGLSSVTVQNSLRAIGQVIEHAIMRGWVKRNVLRDKKVRLPTNRENIAVPSIEDLQKILKSSAIREHKDTKSGHMMKIAIICLAVFTGMRRGEICGLQWENVDFQQGIIRVRHSLSTLDGLKKPKSRSGVRDIPMNHPVRTALQAIWETFPDRRNGYVLRGRTGKKINPTMITGHYWHRILKIAGLLTEDGKPMYRFHSLRHAATSLLLLQGLPIHHTQRLIGHSTSRTTMDIYAHLFPEDTAARDATTAVAEKLLAARAREMPITI